MEPIPTFPSTCTRKSHYTIFCNSKTGGCKDPDHVVPYGIPIAIASSAPILNRIQNFDIFMISMRRSIHLSLNSCHTVSEEVAENDDEMTVGVAFEFYKADYIFPEINNKESL